MKSVLYISSNEQFRSLFAGALKPLGFKAFHYVYNADSAIRAMRRQDYSVIIFHEIAQGKPKDLVPIERLRSETNCPLVLVGYPANFFDLARRWNQEQEIASHPSDESASEPPTDSDTETEESEGTEAEEEASTPPEEVAEDEASEESGDEEAEEGEEPEEHPFEKNVFITPSPISAANLASTVREAVTPADNPLVARLITLPGFKVFSEHSLNYLVSHLKAIQLAENEVLFEAGQVGKSMFFVLTGKIDIRIDDETVETVSTGGIFGEMAMLEGEHRSADAVASSPALLLEVSSDQVEKGDHEFRSILYEVLSRNLVRRLRETNRRLWSQS
ncbi:MAG: hypothetical protein CMH55_04390 [Myxococcales bacterium]|nr:hypothetical protein [Myxococcales bacterium]|tara:strand:+ start:1075 stop:2070 length:996 start_codon:yes stop_codon:yes gene_type:complete